MAAAARECADDNDFEGWRAARETHGAPVAKASTTFSTAGVAGGVGAGAPVPGWGGRRWRWRVGCLRRAGPGWWRPR